MFVTCMFFMVGSFLLGLVLLLIGSHQMVKEAVNIAKSFGVSSFIVGTFLVGFGTSIPELLVSANAIWYGAVDISVGNAIGSYISNIGLVLGFTAVIRPVVMPPTTISQELPLLFIALIVTIFLVVDGYLSGTDGYIMLVLFAIFTLITLFNSPLNTQPSTTRPLRPLTLCWQCLMFLFFLSMLLIGSDMMVNAAIDLAKYFNISELVVGLSMVAVGTSLPELATALMSIVHEEDDLCVGNIIGSNIFCLLGILPLPVLIDVHSISTENLWREFSVMIVMTMLFWIFAAKFDDDKRIISRLEGSVLLLAFFAYITSLFV